MILETERYFGGRARLLRLTNHIDERGVLVPLEFADLPFAPRRAFFVRDVPAGQSRGGHAHSRGQQLFIRVSGEVTVELRCEAMQNRVSLKDSTHGLLVGPLIWTTQTYSGPDATLLVLASEPYSKDAYVSDSC